MSSQLPYNLQWAQADLDKALAKFDPIAVRAGLQDLLNQLTWGVDVSPLLGVIIMASETHDIPCKRMVYTIMTSIARKDPNTSILITNTLLKDCASDNPIVRGMALRAICDIEITTMQDELPKIVALGLADTNPYVRRMAVLATIHLNRVMHSAIEEKGIVNRLYELLRDRDPQIICNSLFALADILKDDGGIAFDVSLIHHLVNSLPKFSEWAQSEAMQVISQYVPSSDKERYDLMNIIDQFLSSSAAAVLTAAAKILITLTNERGDLQRQVVGRALPKFITQIHSASPELQFCLLKHLVVLAKRFPTVFKPHIPHFYVNFSDDPTVARAKFELLEVITDDIYAREVIDTTARYVLLEKPLTIEYAIKLMRDLALRLPSSVQFIISKMRLFFDMKRHNLINQCLIILPDLMRRLPLSLPDFISLLPAEPPNELSGPALGSYAWILGEYGDRLPDSVYCLEHLMLRSWGAPTDAKSDISAHDEQSMMKICLMTALAKLFFITPGEARPVLAQSLSLGVKDNHPGVKSRALFLYNLFKADLEAARAALLTSKQSMEPFVEDADAENTDMIFDEFNTFSVIYEQPQADWDKGQEELDLEIDEEEEEDQPEHRLEDFEEISPEDFQAVWTSPEVHIIEDSVNLGFELDLSSFVDALVAANVGVMASGATEDGGSKVFAYGYIEGNLVLIECVEKGGEMSFTIKAETDALAEQFKDFWLGLFNE
ncbi:beta-adaptin-like protein a [Histomonas meleagridis]|uniref:beta-adaptin-like protein a n=1 Tax=Histomonas meleagridis TaxID=135588 RepID=UPI00355A5C53|nr:beta-adaptin-like protein a [Histomonas meleagridis]KAH0796664.1 beta-adaptin-like protein a [Histomonas meleagridis]